MVVKKTKKLALAMIISCLDGVRYPGKSIVGSIYVSTPSYNICQCPLILIHFSRFQWRYTHKLHIHSTERETHTHTETQAYVNLIFWKPDHLLFCCFFTPFVAPVLSQVPRSSFFVSPTSPLPLPPNRTLPHPKKRGIIPASNGSRDHANGSKNKKEKMKFG